MVTCLALSLLSSKGLPDASSIEGENIGIEWRWAERQYDRLPSLVGDLLTRKVPVIVAFDAPAVFAAKAQPRSPRLFSWPALIQSRVASSRVSAARAATSPARAF
jgi:hypothetical protein